MTNRDEVALTGYRKAWPMLRKALGLPEDHESGNDVLARISELRLAEMRVEELEAVLIARAALSVKEKLK